MPLLRPKVPKPVSVAELRLKAWLAEGRTRRELEAAARDVVQAVTSPLASR
jgi:hypothetical protein